MAVYFLQVGVFWGLLTNLFIRLNMDDTFVMKLVFRERIANISEENIDIHLVLCPFL